MPIEHNITVTSEPGDVDAMRDLLDGLLRGPKFDTISGMLASERPALANGEIWEAAGFRYEVAEPSTPIVNGYPLLTEGGVKLYVLANCEGRVTTGQFGQPTVSTDPGLFLQIAYYAGFRDAVLTGAKAVWLSGSREFPGMTVRGNGHRISPNGGQLKGCTLIGVIHDKDTADYFPAILPPAVIPSSVRPKILHRAADTADGQRFQVITCGQDDRYRMETVETGNGPDDWDANHGMARVVGNIDVRHAFVCLNNWTRASAGVSLFGGSVEGLLMSTSGLAPLDSNGAEIGNTISAYAIPGGGAEFVEYDVNVGSVADEWNILYYTSGASSDSVGVYVDDVLVDTFTAKNAVSGQTVKLHTIKPPRRSGSTRKIKIQNNGAGTFYFVCLNYFPLRDYKPEVPVDTWKIYQDSWSWFDNAGASDYALQPASGGGVYIGSYHGGETSNYLRWTVGRSLLNPASGFPVGAFHIGQEIYLKQRTTINAGADGSLDTYSSTIWSADGQYTFKCNFQGSMDVNFAYTCMSPANSDMDWMLHPYDANIGAGASYPPLGNYNDVVQYSYAGLYFLRSTFTLFDPSRNSYGGAYIWNRGTTYKKLYYGPIVQNRGTVRELSFEATREFGFGKY